MQDNENSNFLLASSKFVFNFVSIKTKLMITVIGIVAFIILCCFGYILSLENSFTKPIKDNHKTLGLVVHEELIYKGGELPIPFINDYYVITSKFNPARVHPVTGVLRPHKGIDLVSYKDCEIISVASGKVTISAFDKTGYGHWVEVEHNSNFKTRYAHMKDIPQVKVGDMIEAGTVLGVQGSTGGSTGDHLHFEVIIDGIAQDPEPYLFGKR